MDDGKRNLKGSEAKDEFKRWHKTLPSSFYACDGDLILIVKYPNPKPIAVIDYKTVTDGTTFVEVILYNWLLKQGVPVFIISTIPALPPYTSVTIKKYLGGDWKPNPPITHVVPILTGMPISDFERWESQLRNDIRSS